jgi:hypothetical protein
MTTTLALRSDFNRHQIRKTKDSLPAKYRRYLSAIECLYSAGTVAEAAKAASASSDDVADWVNAFNHYGLKGLQMVEIGLWARERDRLLAGSKPVQTAVPVLVTPARQQDNYRLPDGTVIPIKKKTAAPQTSSRPTAPARPQAAGRTDDLPMFFHERRAAGETRADNPTYSQKTVQSLMERTADKVHWNRLKAVLMSYRGASHATIAQRCDAKPQEVAEWIGRFNMFTPFALAVDDNGNAPARTRAVSLPDHQSAQSIRAVAGRLHDHYERAAFNALADLYDGLSVEQAADRRGLEPANLEGYLSTFRLVGLKAVRESIATENCLAAQPVYQAAAYAS